MQPSLLIYFCRPLRVDVCIPHQLQTVSVIGTHKANGMYSKEPHSAFEELSDHLRGVLPDLTRCFTRPDRSKKISRDVKLRVEFGHRRHREGSTTTSAREEHSKRDREVDPAGHWAAADRLRT
jgi:hypothetical protein